MRRWIDGWWFRKCHQKDTKNYDRTEIRVHLLWPEICFRKFLEIASFQSWYDACRPITTFILLSKCPSVQVRMEVSSINATCARFISGPLKREMCIGHPSTMRPLTVTIAIKGVRACKICEITACAPMEYARRKNSVNSLVKFAKNVVMHESPTICTWRINTVGRMWSHLRREYAYAKIDVYSVGLRALVGEKRLIDW